MEEQLSELEEYTLQLAAIEEELSKSPKAAVDEELLTLKAELTDLINLLNQSLGLDVKEAVGSKNDLHSETIKVNGKNANVLKQPEVELEPLPTPIAPKENLTSAPPPPPPPPASSLPKYLNPPSDLPAYKVGDFVLAKWAKGDKQYHKAKITAVTGSTNNPLYTVRYFIPHDDNKIIETISLNLIKSVYNNDNSNYSAHSSGFSPAVMLTTTAQTNYNNRTKRSAAALDEPIGKEAISPSFKKEKILTSYQKQTKSLEKAASSWQSFAKNGSKKKGVKIGENSMFRSPGDVNGKVGVIGSGKRMTKDTKRLKHIFNDKPNNILG
ncbi:hypothetical protein NADFUDRAFT_67246 [Nadsonia fulvescens var. elongata DSM 6958]|uniref:Tudor domain-containing protein n=1 Tax=Nadsonia fulvescens var. elongata DSM 6958 TaxID=857566 RepID=A0A1E3PEY1_9ASCO|nr:hypothetical protein NADFUDRAFT_67246 [Nadsonia fulvescens var. elongata DSM 6958]